MSIEVSQSAGVGTVSRLAGVEGTRLTARLGGALGSLAAPFLVLIFAKFWFFSAIAPSDFDFWWHLRTGQYIVEQAQLPRVDPFSHTAAGTPWTTHEWLTEVAIFLIQSRFGYAALVGLFAAIATASMLLVYLACRQRGLGQAGSALLMLLAAALGSGLANVRAQALTGLLVVVWLLLLRRYRQGHRRALWALPPLMVVWVNLHGGFVIGLVLLGLMAVGEAASRLLGRPAAPLGPLLIATVACSGAALLSPHGLDGLLYPLTYAGTGNPSAQFIKEWQSPSFHGANGLPLAAALLLLAVVGLGGRPLGLTDLAWGGLLMTMALVSLRHTSLFGLIVVPLIAARLPTLLPPLGRALRPRSARLLLIAAWLLALAGVAISYQQAVSLGAPAIGSLPRDVTYPRGGMAYLRDQAPPGRLFNEYRWGGYLIQSLYPHRAVFIDGRADVYGGLVGEYVKVSRLEPGWREVLDRYGVELALVDKDGPLAVALALDPTWTELYAGQVERLFWRQAQSPAP